MRQDDLGRHAAEHQGHGEAVEDEMVVFEDERVRRAQPGHGGCAKDNQRCPLPKDREYREVLSASSACNIKDAGGKMGNEESGQNHGDPEIPEGHLAEVLSKAWEVVDKGCRPDLGSEVPRHANKCASKNKTLYGMLSEKSFVHWKYIVPVGPLK